MSDNTTPNLSESNLVRYLHKFFPGIGLNKCDGFDEAVTILQSQEEMYVPEGLNEECILLLERMNVRGSLWAMKPSTPLTNMLIELAGDEGRGYFIISDNTLVGADSILLCAVSVTDDAREMNEDLSYVIKSWTQHGAPVIMIGGLKDKKHGGAIHAVAAQLKTLL